MHRAEVSLASVGDRRMIRAATSVALQERVERQKNIWEALLRQGIGVYTSFKETAVFRDHPEHWPMLAGMFEATFNLERSLSAPKEAGESAGSALVIDDELMHTGEDRAIGKSIAFFRTAAAQAVQTELHRLIVESLRTDPAIRWEDLIVDRDPARPAAPELRVPPPPALKPVPPEPDWKALRLAHTPRLAFSDWFSSARRRESKAEAEVRINEFRREWGEECARVESQNAAELLKHNAKVSELRSAHSRHLEALENEWVLKTKMRLLVNELIVALQAGYPEKDPDAVARYCEAVLINSNSPECLPMSTHLAYTRDNGLLVVDYMLPSPGDIPTLLEVKFVQTTKQYTEKHLSGSKRAELYDDVVYQIVLRTLDELFRSDRAGALSSVVLNGIVASRDRATGRETKACILSIQVSRNEFETIDLANVDPKACFRQLKGVGSSKLHSITPVAPIVRLKTDDPRLVESHAVGESLDAGSNLAAMDWEEFEHFIREIFEKEFVSPGSQVRVTRASRDGGVDAIVFDPDPIRGGKIVIQAKRYTNTVGVSAVRDLYGTVMNEGALKGILVTTSDYGPDAYEFASGKPLTLLSGSNLLHLLSKHGIKAHIDLLDAKRLASEETHNPQHSPALTAGSGDSGHGDPTPNP